MQQPNNIRIVKNTIFLYVRMAIMMLVTLYTSRLVIDILGISDFGIFSLIGGIVVLLTFLNNAMSSATQRYLSYELGKENINRIRQIFSMSMTAHISIALFVFVLAETLGLWFIKTQLNIPEDREFAAGWVYQFAVFTFIINIIRVPYNASLVSAEKMSFYAFISVLETSLKLGCVYFLIVSPWDKLIVYSALICITSLICTYIFKIYCCRALDFCRYHFFWDKVLYMKMMHFSGWSVVGGVANIGAQQGGNILINFFSGLTANAAFGISTQVSNAVNSFASNFQMAFNPQIVKLYAHKNYTELYKLMYHTSSLSYYLLLIFSVPILLYTEPILVWWLQDVPNYSVIFCRLMIVYCLIDAIQAPLWFAIIATGKIKVYEIWLSVLLVLNIPISWYLLKEGWSPVSVLGVKVILNFISAVIRTFYVKSFIGFPIGLYFRKVILKAFIVTLIAFLLAIGIDWMNSFSKVYSVLGSFLLVPIVIYWIGLSSEERKFINKFLNRIFIRNKSIENI